VIGSFMSLFWAFFLMLCFSLLFAIVLVQRLTTYVAENKLLPPPLLSKIFEDFGSVEVATFTLFKGISGGDWTTYYATVSSTGWINSVIFLIYISFIWLSVTNIITCIFVEKAMKLARPEVDELLFEKQKDDLENAEELDTIFREMDLDHKGSMSWADFQAVIDDPRVASHLEIHGLDINDAFMFFSMLTSISGKDQVDVDTFIRGCLKMKGVAMNIDLIQLNYEVKIISKTQQQMFNDVAAGIQRLYRQMVQIAAGLQQPAPPSYTDDAGSHSVI